MVERRSTKERGSSQRGASLVLVGFSLVTLLAVAGLAVDLASLYVGRSEAQRAADAAALAGAQRFVLSGYSSGVVSAAVAQTQAARQAATVGNENLVGGRSANISPSPSASCPPSPNTVCFDFSNPLDPRISVAVQQAMPTFFMKIFGVENRDVWAMATAEAYTPATSGPAIGTQCAKPWLLPNCNFGAPGSEWVPAGNLAANKNCPTGTTDSAGNALYYPFFVYPNTSTATTGGTIVNQDALGERFVIKPGDPSGAAAPSQFYPSYFNPSSANFSCPACGSSSGAGGGGLPSGNLYQTNIECCNQSIVSCGTNPIQPITGNKSGPTFNGVMCLINQQKNGSGQDILLDPTNTRVIEGGSNNPDTSLRGVQGLTTSPSLVSVPLYDGAALCSGMNCVSSVDVQGFLQMFISNVSTGGTNPGTVSAYVYNVVGCSSPSSGTITAAGGATIPVRLIHN